MAIDAGYGDSQSGKSKALEMLAGHLFQQSGKKTRVYSSDGGQETYNDRGLVDDGVIELMDVSTRAWPMTVLKLISDFYFLKDPKDPNSKLVAPAVNLYETHGLIIYEGGTTIGNWLLSDVPGGLAWHAATETKFGGIKDEDGVLSTEDDLKVEGDYNLQGANSPKHFMIAQRKIVTAVRTSKKFPGMVWWTFHPTVGPDKGGGGESGKFGAITGKKLIGPDAGGSALVSTIGKEFGNLLHFDQVTLPNKKELDETSKKTVTQVEKEFRVYTKRHYDPEATVAIEYVAGARARVADYYVSKEPGDSILQFYQSVAEERKKAKEKRG